MARVRVFISFDYDHDEDLKNLPVGQARNPDSPFEINDFAVKQYLTGDWKDKVHRRIRSAEPEVVGPRAAQKIVKRVANRAQLNPGGYAAHPSAYVGNARAPEENEPRRRAETLGHDRLATMDLNLTDTHIVEEFEAKW